MSVEFLIHALVGLFPVCIFLVGLVLLDSYKLVDVRWIIGTIIVGGTVAGVSYLLNRGLLDVLAINFTTYSRSL